MAVAERILHLNALVDPRSDKALVQFAKQGKSDATSSLVARYYPRVHSFVSYLTNSGRADDLTQEVFTRALSGLHRFNGAYQFEPWLLRIARNLVIDEARRKKAMPTDPSQMCDLEDTKLASDVVWESMDRKLVNIKVKQALSKLPLRQRTVLVLREIEELSYAEIAQIVGTNIRGVEATLRRARQRFRNEATDLKTSTTSRVSGVFPLLGPLLGGLGDRIRTRFRNIDLGVAPMAQLAEVVASVALAGSIALAPVAAVKAQQVTSSAGAPVFSLSHMQMIEQELRFETLTPYGEPNPLLAMHAAIEAKQLEERTKHERPLISLAGVNIANPGLPTELSALVTDLTPTIAEAVAQLPIETAVTTEVLVDLPDLTATLEPIASTTRSP
ncbi:MAG: sigma-70 family RNA polymerase sigma factor [Actinomycetota bacterium]